MPRFARLHHPGAVVHVIGRFVNRELRLDRDRDRVALLARIGPALRRCDWSLHAFALMGSHIHLALVAGQDPPWRLLKPLHISFASYLNRAHDRLGPVFAGRATTVYMETCRLAPLVAYIHNNPVRAAVASSADRSTWTSHRLLLGLDPTPPWLSPGRTMHLLGFGDSAMGRRRFHEFVSARSGDPRDAVLSGDRAARDRAKLRGALALPIEISSSSLAGEDPSVAIELPTVDGPPARWNGPMDSLLRRASQLTGVSLSEIRSRSARRQAAAARRLVVVAGAWLLRRPVGEIAATLGIADSSASRLLRGADGVLELATQLARDVRGSEGATQDIAG